MAERHQAHRANVRAGGRVHAADMALEIIEAGEALAARGYVAVVCFLSRMSPLMTNEMGSIRERLETLVAAERSFGEMG